MNRRLKKCLLLVVEVMVFMVLLMFSAKTIWVGLNLSFFSNEVVESNRYAYSNPNIRIGADKVYEEVNLARSEFYNSSDSYIRWISNMKNIVRVPLGIIIILSPYLWMSSIRKYNMSIMRRRRKTRI